MSEIDAVIERRIKVCLGVSPDRAIRMLKNLVAMVYAAKAMTAERAAKIASAHAYHDLKRVEPRPAIPTADELASWPVQA